MNDVAIREPVHRPVSAFREVLCGLSTVEFATSALTSRLQRIVLGDDAAEHVVLGKCHPSGESPAIGRIAALDAGLGHPRQARGSTGVAGPGCPQCSTRRCRSVPVLAPW